MSMTKQKTENMNTKQMTYAQAAERIDEIVRQIEAGELGLDDLSAKVKEAADLVTFCKKKLQETDESIEKLLENL